LIFFQSIIGTVYGLGSSFSWALGNIALKSQAGKIPPLSVNFLRSVLGSAFYLTLIPFLDGWTVIFTLGMEPFLALILVVIIGFILSETLYLKSIEITDVNIVTPIFWSYPVFTSIFAWQFLSEVMTIRMVAGVILVVIGVGLISSNNNKGRKDYLKEKNPYLHKGILLSIFSSLSWGIGATIMKVGVIEGNPIILAAILTWLNSLVLLFFPVQIKRIFNRIHKDSRFFTANIFASLVGGPVLCNILYILAVRNVGASRAAVLGATAPLFTTIIAKFFLGEKLNQLVITGTVMTVLGVALNIG
jgi:drug/metabolite transporter (DMT)-like permease